MSVYLDYEKCKKSIKKMPMEILATGIIAITLLGFMVAYFWANYRGENAEIPIRENLVGFHDDLFDIHAGTGGQAWAVGKNGLILHTNDEGRNWQQQASGTTRALSAVSFADDQRVGFAVGARGTILATHDGGLSWRMQNSGVEEYLLGVQVLDGTKAYVAGPFGTFLSTSDGGTNWVKHEFQWRKLISSVFEESHMQNIEPNLNAVHFVRPEIGWVVGEFGLILHTRDGGQTWTVQRSGSSLPDLFGLIFLDEHRGWAMGHRGTVIRTNDGGQHWLPVNLETSRDIYGACFEGQRIALVGDRIFLMTENGGSTWTRRDVAENAVINGIAFASTHVILVGQAGLIKSVQ